MHRKVFRDRDQSMESLPFQPPPFRKQWQTKVLGALAIVAVVALMLAELKQDRDRKEADERPVNAPLQLQAPAATTTAPASR